MARVKLREKPIKGNQLSLYYDYYPPIKASATDPETRREFTGLIVYSEIEYTVKENMSKAGRRMTREGKVSKAGNKYETLIPVLDRSGKPKKRKLTPEEIQYNQETRDQAREGMVKRQGMINKGDYSFLAPKAKVKDFIIYCEDLAKEKTVSTGEGWTSAIKHLKKYSGGSVPMSVLTKSFCEGFKKHLLTAGIANNSAATYFNKFKAALREAYKTDPQILITDLSALVDAIPEKETKIDYLTAEELQLLINKPFPDLPVLKSAAIFSALTNLRYGNIAKLKWSEIRTEANANYISFITEKNKKVMVMPVPPSAVSVSLIGERREPDQLVFPGLAYSTENNNKMHKWIKSAGITKHITFHGFRHTWAVLQQERGTDLHTQSKMMSHSDIKTTQIYSEIRNPAMTAAAARMDTFDFSKFTDIPL
jgi:integrase